MKANVDAMLELAKAMHEARIEDVMFDDEGEVRSLKVFAQPPQSASEPATQQEKTVHEPMRAVSGLVPRRAPTV